MLLNDIQVLFSKEADLHRKDYYLILAKTRTAR